jgi:hypothetical protein
MDTTSSPRLQNDALDARKAWGRAWFEQLRDDICAALEAIEDALPAGGPWASNMPAVSRGRHGAAPTTPAHLAAAA